MCFLKEYRILSIIIDVFLQKKKTNCYNLNLIKSSLSSGAEGTQIVEEAVKRHHEETMRQLQNMDILMTTDMLSPRSVSWKKVSVGIFVEEKK